jgi:hypothetical protein
MTRRLVMLTAALLACATFSPCRAEESPAERTAREWFLAAAQGDHRKVEKLTRVPFLANGIVIPTAQLMEELVYAPMQRQRRKPEQQDIPLEAIKVKKIERYRPMSAALTQSLDMVAAHQFVEMTVGKDVVVVYLTKGAKPKVVGMGK